jgi:hypothetical protein
MYPRFTHVKHIPEIRAIVHYSVLLAALQGRVDSRYNFYRRFVFLLLAH